MTYVKKLVMYGFKSFPKKTELPFTQGINVILGPNGSGKSNISDALCFVLGRLSIKSMRAAKAGNLIFLGSKIAGPAKEASVEIVFDNSSKIFSLEKNEVSIRRIVRKNGQSIYKINEETKTRQDILFLLSQAGIDPNGFNIILQGEIQNFVMMQPDERRKVIEEVSGISIYEVRKEKSIKELEKTEEKLKEIGAILRERTSYLNNLEKERQEALKFKKLQQEVISLKASIISNDLSFKQKEAEKIMSEISKKEKEIEGIKAKIRGVKAEILNHEAKINFINSEMQKSTGLEQERLNTEIANLRAEIAGMKVKSENYESKILENSRQKEDIQKNITESGEIILELEKSTPKDSKEKKYLEIKKREFEKIEEQRKRMYVVKSELKSIKERLQDKSSILQNYRNEAEFFAKQIDHISKDIFDKNTDEKKISELKKVLAEKISMGEELESHETNFGKASYAKEQEIDKQKKIMENISKMDTCPLCKSKITKGHVHSIGAETEQAISKLKIEIENSDRETKKIYEKKKILKEEIEKITSDISKRESDILKISTIMDKKEQIKLITEKIKRASAEIQELEGKKNAHEKISNENMNIDQKYETILVEIQEMSVTNKENISSEVEFKQREIDRLKISLKQILRNEEDIKEDIIALRKILKQKEEMLFERKRQDEDLSRKFQKLIAERDSHHSEIRKKESDCMIKQNIIQSVEQDINNFKIDKAKIGAEIENLEVEILEFSDGIEIIKIGRSLLSEKLAKAQETLSRIGAVNLRSLEVYDEVKKEYDSVKEKAEVISKEKESVLRIIYEIDTKKKKTFFRTINSLNETFSRNFSQLSVKGQVSLDLENKQNPFEGGVNIIVKTGHGKYFDVKSLSGGEQTLVALSLIFAIQELNPYHFYILDEIDAALDKKNSERLAELLKKYMKKGQYIVITHNDEIMTNATSLYGVSMHDGISKIVSLRI